MLNTLCLVARLTKDPELAKGKEGLSIANVSLAFDTGKEETSFIDGVALGNTAEAFINYTHKGDLVAISGSLHQRKWVSKDGRNASKIEVKINEVQFLTPKKEEEVPDADFPPEEQEVEVPKGYHKDKNGNLIKDKPSKK